MKVRILDFCYMEWFHLLEPVIINKSVDSTKESVINKSVDSNCLQDFPKRRKWVHDISGELS